VAGRAADLRPRPLLRAAVLREDGEVRLAVVQPQLDHLPVALVAARSEREVVVVVEVPEPVLQPDPPAGLDGAPVDAVAQVRARGAQRDVLAAVVRVRVADTVPARDGLAARVALGAEERERQAVAGARQQCA
jgi:hypothetical protein